MMNNNFPSYFYTKDGIRIFYTTNFKPADLKEDDIVIVFNYGLVCNNAHWKYQIPFFDQLGYKILTHDYRFHFSSSRSKDIADCSFQNITEDMDQLINHLGIKKCIMLGHSMGVNVTLEYALKFPEKVCNMILISGTVLPPQDIMFNSNIVEVLNPYIEWVTQKFPNLFDRIWRTQYMNPLTREIMYRGGFNRKKVSEEFIHVYMKKISELSPEVFFQLMNEMRNHEIIPHLESIQVPALVMGGDLDQVIPNYLQKILHNYLPNSELYVIKDGSHVPQADFPETINQRIYNFIKKKCS